MRCRFDSLNQVDPLEEGMGTHSSVLAWRIPWTEEPGGLQSTGSESRTRLKQLSTHKVHTQHELPPLLRHQRGAWRAVVSNFGTVPRIHFR